MKVQSYIFKFVRNPFLAGGLIMVVGTNFYSLGQFIYHSLALRLLSGIYGVAQGTAYYGDLAAIISILGIIGIAQVAVGLTIVKFVASEKKFSQVANFIKWLDLWSILGGIFLAIPFLLFFIPISKFFNISQPLALLMAVPAIPMFFVTNTSRSVLQGLLKFDKMVLSLLVEIFPKLFLTAIFIMRGYALYGMMSALLIGFSLMFFVTRLFVSPYLKGPRGKRPNVGPLIRYSVPVFVQALALTSMYSTDILLVKHFFSPEKAGLYAFLAVLGRVAFFASSPIAGVMFPVVAQRNSRSEPYMKIFYLSILFVVGVSGFVVIFYRLFPLFVINVFSGSISRDGAEMLWWFGLFMGLISLAALLTQFYLSVGKTKVVWLFALAAFLQGILIWFIHSDLLTVIKLSVLSAGLLNASLIVYFPYFRR